MSLQTVITYSLSAITAAAVFCFAFFLQWYWRRERLERHRFRQVRENITDLTILFQTMRDLVRQQKQLAQEFNEDLDRKLGLVKQILQQSVGRNEELYLRQQALTTALEETRSHLESLQRQYALLENSALNLGIQAKPSSTPASAASSKMAKAAAFPSPAEAARSQTPEKDSLYIFHESPHSFPENIPAESPEEAPFPPFHAEDTENAREAFHTLLDFEVASPDNTDTIAPMAAPPPTAPASSGNGHKAVSPENYDESHTSMAALQRRVEEYHRAGMEVADIARELGIGKGEVRLMLSLMRQQSH